MIVTKEKKLSGKFDNASSIPQTWIVEVVDSYKLSSAQNMKRTQYTGAHMRTHARMHTYTEACAHVHECIHIHTQSTENIINLKHCYVKFRENTIHKNQ